MCMCVHLCVCLCVCVRLCVFVCLCVHVRAGLWACICPCAWEGACMHEHYQCLNTFASAVYPAAPHEHGRQCNSPGSGRLWCDEYPTPGAEEGSAR